MEIHPNSRYSYRRRGQRGRAGGLSQQQRIYQLSSLKELSLLLQSRLHFPQAMMTTCVQKGMIELARLPRQDHARNLQTPRKGSRRWRYVH
jgi:hypothetical protein